jgi:excisionase family DNA binding protein
MTNAPSKEVLTTQEACKFLRISKPTLFKLIHGHQIPAKRIGRGWRLLKSELEAYLRQEDIREKRVSEIDELEGTRYQKDNPPLPAKVLSPVDQSILRILSLYEHLTLLQLWYEIGENHALGGRLTEKEIERRLQSLTRRGFVENIGDGNSETPKYRLRMRDGLDEAEIGGQVPEDRSK